MKKILAEMVIKWYESGCTPREIAHLLPQCNPEEIKVIINNHTKETEA